MRGVRSGDPDVSADNGPAASAAVDIEYHTAVRFPLIPEGYE